MKGGGGGTGNSFHYAKTNPEIKLSPSRSPRHRALHSPTLPVWSSRMGPPRSDGPPLLSTLTI